MDVPDESSPGADDNNAMEADLLAEVWNSYDDPDDHVRGTDALLFPLGIW